MTRDIQDLFVSFAGPAVWFAHFIAVYAAEGVACAKLPEDAAATVAASSSVILTVLALALLGWLTYAAWHRNPYGGRFEDKPFLDKLAIGLVGTSALGVVWSGIAAAYVRPCIASATG